MGSKKTHKGNLVSVTSRDGTEIAVSTVGSGPALVCVDGALCTRRQGPGKSLAPRLSERFTVYTYDRRGRGDSGDAQRYSPEREIEDLEAVIAHAGGEAAVFGHSSGAVLALMAAVRGVPIKRLALYETPFVVDGTRRPVGEEWAVELRSLIDTGRRGRAVKRFMTEVACAPAFVPVVMSLTPMWPGLKAIAHTLAYDSALMAAYQTGKPEAIDRFASIDTPTLLLLGGKSPEWIKNAVHTLGRALPNAELKVLDRQTHMVKAKATAPALLEFLGAESPSAAARQGSSPGRTPAPQPQS
jgi:pimeloyl-ACP methyl ester carboxylesterase